MTTTSSDSQAFQALETQYFYLNTNFNRLFAAAKTPEDQDTLRQDFVQARDNYRKAQVERFRDGDPMVQDLTAKVVAAQKQIEASAEKLQDVSKVLDLVTDAVNLASRLVILAAA
ncbi:MAG TPA: hypothetical protein VHQ65_14680 [Thermoanaerobaculia bacterium]|nr:hypothetical protein [Thermoanaerobaculia bacterium]